jgi:hypothetical protein
MAMPVIIKCFCGSQVSVSALFESENLRLYKPKCSFCLADWLEDFEAEPKVLEERYMTKSWGKKSTEVIDTNFARMKKEYPNLPDAEILKVINREYYPFGERAYFPYKAWCKALRNYKTKLGVKVTSRKPVEAMPLFDK